MMGVLNFAHAYFFMLGAYLCYQVVSTTHNFWLALLVAPIFVALLGILIERYLLRRVRGYRIAQLGELLLTLGISLVIADVVKYVWGTDNLAITPPDSLAGAVTVAGSMLPLARLFVVGLSLAILILLAYVLLRTRLGTIVRAAVSDSDMVAALGINTPRISMLVFGIGSWMAGVAGVALTLYQAITPGMAEVMALDSFVVVVVGGFGSLAGAFMVSLILGELNAFGITFLPKLAPVLVFAFMALVLAMKPTGFFGERK
jgi:branched-chain amino acid transport system permease protein